ncbi:hypothetical protein [Paenibacillus sp. HJGM_3]|uniref:hypothetical protein n=1 Tax=Paenibacillus sp. HJGM_3 TaxID=3379816 RepID=UPI0038597337
MNIARIGVLFNRRAAEARWRYGINVFERHIGEMLEQAGLPFDWLEETNHALEAAYDVVLVAAMEETAADYEQLWLYASRGGVVIAFAGLNGLARRLGCRRGPLLGAGYARLPAPWGPDRPLRYLRALPWQPDAPCEVLAAAVGAAGDAAPALLQLRVENGYIDRWSVDIPFSVIGLQQGLRPVAEDGAPAPDGSAPLDDGVLKAEDELQLDWVADRTHTETGAPYFGVPYADHWRETIVAHILQRITEKGKTLPFVDVWPEGVTGIATISHDSDRNHDTDAETTLRVLAECGIRSTWCMMKPGYSFPYHQRIREAGHELALHFNANVREGGSWSEADFRRQYEWLTTVNGGEAVTSNKNHFTRFEGWGELFAWCEACGIEVDQTRGPSKTGTVGFTFATCQPYFPIAWFDEGNRHYDVLEIGFLTQDLGAMTDMSVVQPFLDAVREVQGVAHFLFHQGRIHSADAVRESLIEFVRIASGKGFAFWTSREINAWHRARRRLKVVGLGIDSPDEVVVQRSATSAAVVIDPVEAASPVVWIPLRPGEEDGLDASVQVERKYGVLCRKGRISYADIS